MAYQSYYHLTKWLLLASGKCWLSSLYQAGLVWWWWWRERLVTSHTLPPPPVDTEARPVAVAWPGRVLGLVLAAARFS